MFEKVSNLFEINTFSGKWIRKETRSNWWTYFESSRDGILPNVAHSEKPNLPIWPVYGRGRVNIIYILVPKATGSLMDGSASIVQYVSSLSHSQLHFVCPFRCPPLRNGRRGLVPIKRNGRRTTKHGPASKAAVSRLAVKWPDPISHLDLRF